MREILLSNETLLQNIHKHMATKDDLKSVGEQLKAANDKLAEQASALNTISVNVTKVAGETTGLSTKVTALTQSNTALAARIAELEAIINNGEQDPELVEAVNAVKEQAQQVSANAISVAGGVADLGAAVKAVDDSVPDGEGDGGQTP